MGSSDCGRLKYGAKVEPLILGGEVSDASEGVSVNALNVFGGCLDKLQGWYFNSSSDACDSDMLSDIISAISEAEFQKTDDIDISVRLKGSEAVGNLHIGNVRIYDEKGQDVELTELRIAEESTDPHRGCTDFRLGSCRYLHFPVKDLEGLVSDIDHGYYGPDKLTPTYLNTINSNGKVEVLLQMNRDVETRVGELVVLFPDLDFRNLLGLGCAMHRNAYDISGMSASDKKILQSLIKSGTMRYGSKILDIVRMVQDDIKVLDYLSKVQQFYVLPSNTRALVANGTSRASLKNILEYVGNDLALERLGEAETIYKRATDNLPKGLYSRLNSARDQRDFYDKVIIANEGIAVSEIDNDFLALALALYSESGYEPRRKLDFAVSITPDYTQKNALMSAMIKSEGASKIEKLMKDNDTFFVYIQLVHDFFLLETYVREYVQDQTFENIVAYMSSPTEGASEDRVESFFARITKQSSLDIFLSPVEKREFYNCMLRAQEHLSIESLDAQFLSSALEIFASYSTFSNDASNQTLTFMCTSDYEDRIFALKAIIPSRGNYGEAFQYLSDKGVDLTHLGIKQFALWLIEYVMPECRNNRFTKFQNYVDGIISIYDSHEIMIQDFNKSPSSFGAIFLCVHYEGIDASNINKVMEVVNIGKDIQEKRIIIHILDRSDTLELEIFFDSMGKRVMTFLLQLEKIALTEESMQFVFNVLREGSEDKKSSNEEAILDKVYEKFGVDPVQVKDGTFEFIKDVKRRYPKQMKELLCEENTNKEDVQIMLSFLEIFASHFEIILTHAKSAGTTVWSLLKENRSVAVKDIGLPNVKQGYENIWKIIYPDSFSDSLDAIGVGSKDNKILWFYTALASIMSAVKDELHRARRTSTADYDIHERNLSYDKKTLLGGLHELDEKTLLESIDQQVLEIRSILMGILPSEEPKSYTNSDIQKMMLGIEERIKPQLQSLPNSTVSQILNHAAYYLEKTRSVQDYYLKYMNEPKQLISLVRGISIDQIHGDVTLYNSGGNLIFLVSNEDDYKKIHGDKSTESWGFSTSKSQIPELRGCCTYVNGGVESRWLTARTMTHESIHSINNKIMPDKGLYLNGDNPVGYAVARAKDEVICMVGDSKSKDEASTALLETGSRGLYDYLYYLSYSDYRIQRESYVPRLRKMIDIAYGLKENGVENYLELLTVVPAEEWESLEYLLGNE